MQIIFITPLVLITIIILVVFIVSWQVAKREKTSVTEEFIGICQSAIEQTSTKEVNKQKTLSFLRERGDQVGNKEIREYLKVARRTVVRYMDELEKEGRVEQIGDIGQGVVYRLK